LITALRGVVQQTLARRIHVITTFAVAIIADSALAPFFFFSYATGDRQRDHSREHEVPH
jgi:hypothetical protein